MGWLSGIESLLVECLTGFTGTGAPKLATGDGALGFWSAVNEAWPTTQHQRCWVHKTANVLAAIPDSIQGKAKAGLKEIWMADTKAQANKAFDTFLLDFEAKYPKAVSVLAKDRESLLAFYDFPAEHWIHIRTTNPIESSFGTIRHRTTRTKNCVSRNTLLGLVFQLALTAEKSWRKIRGFKRLPEVIEGIRFQDGIAVIMEPKQTEDTQQMAA
ncbi:hypothetical protein EQU24_11945 [Methylotuvimicrobium buryatense]|uniref:Mutator family transposase n=1 Tax=Methylotuvimicrobium buryatense TaxID=95641 RepID=A0A4P9UT03_METBY|nr:hypothetical protein EQU24_11945 [Methylotuvimicrobium buryatense]